MTTPRTDVPKPVSRSDAALMLGQACGQPVSPGDVDDLAAAGLLTAVGANYGYPTYDPDAVAALAGREELGALIDEHRLLSAGQATKHLGLRPCDWAYIRAAGWVAPFTVRRRQLGGTRKWGDVALFHKQHLAALAEIPGVDWDEVRAAGRGKPSPLAALVAKPPSRATVVRLWCAKMSLQYGTQVWASYQGETWYIDWDPNPHGQPNRGQLRASLDDPAEAAHRFASQICLYSRAADVVAWARRMVQPGAAVVLDFETTDLGGMPCEVAVINAATGATLLNTLIDPQEPISGQAYAVHGISDDIVAGAPTFDQILPRLYELIGDRTVLAYNAEFDQDTLLHACERLGLNPGWFADPARWACIMVNRAGWERTRVWTRLGGGHRAYADVHAARQILVNMTAPYKPAAQVMVEND